MMNGHTLAGYTYMYARRRAWENISIVCKYWLFHGAHTHTPLVVVEHFMFSYESRAFTHSHNRTHLTMATTRHIHLKSSLTHTRTNTFYRIVVRLVVCVCMCCVSRISMYLSLFLSRVERRDNLFFSKRIARVYILYYGDARKRTNGYASLWADVYLCQRILFIYSHGRQSMELTLLVFFNFLN